MAADPQAAADMMQAGVDTGVLVADIISGYYQLEAAKTARAEAKELALLERSDTLSQNRITNQLAQNRLGLSKDALNWDQVKFAKTYKLTKQEYLDKQAAAMRAEKRVVNQDAINNLVNMYGLQTQTQNQVLSQMGA